jgi:hypothetical protein
MACNSHICRWRSGRLVLYSVTAHEGCMATRRSFALADNDAVRLIAFRGGAQCEDEQPGIDGDCGAVSSRIQSELLAVQRPKHICIRLRQGLRLGGHNLCRPGSGDDIRTPALWWRGSNGIAWDRQVVGDTHRGYHDNNSSRAKQCDKAKCGLVGMDGRAAQVQLHLRVRNHLTTMKTLFSAIASVFLAFAAFAQPYTRPVLYQSWNFTGQLLNNPVTLTALDTPFGISNGIVAGTQILLRPLNGVATTNLVPGDYRIVIGGMTKSWVITVDTSDTNIVNLASIPKAGVNGIDVFYWTNSLEGVTVNLAQTVYGITNPTAITGGTGITITTNGVTNIVSLTTSYPVVAGGTGITVTTNGVTNIVALTQAYPVVVAGAGIAVVTNGLSSTVSVVVPGLSNVTDSGTTTIVRSNMQVAGSIVADIVTATNLVSGASVAGGWGQFGGGSGGSALDLVQTDPNKNALAVTGVEGAGVMTVDAHGNVVGTSFTGTVNGSNLTDGSVNSNKLDTATRALLGAGNGTGSSNITDVAYDIQVRQNALVNGKVQTGVPGGLVPGHIELYDANTNVMASVTNGTFYGNGSGITNTPSLLLQANQFQGFLNFNGDQNNGASTWQVYDSVYGLNYATLGRSGLTVGKGIAANSLSATAIDGTAITGYSGQFSYLNLLNASPSYYTIGANGFLLDYRGNVTANSLTGNGSGLTNISSTNISGLPVVTNSPLTAALSATNNYFFFEGDSLTAPNNGMDWPAQALSNQLFFKGRYAFSTNIACSSDGMLSNVIASCTITVSGGIGRCQMSPGDLGYYPPAYILITSSSKPDVNGYYHNLNIANQGTYGTTNSVWFTTSAADGSASDGVAVWGALARYPRMIHPLAPTHEERGFVFCYAGMNDRGEMLDPSNLAAYLGRWMAYATMVHNDGMKLVAFTVHPASDVPVGGATDIARRNYNSQFRGMTNVFDVLIDLETVFNNGADPRFFNGGVGNVHFNTEGNHRIAALVDEKMMLLSYSSGGTEPYGYTPSLIPAWQLIPAVSNQDAQIWNTGTNLYEVRTNGTKQILRTGDTFSGGTVTADNGYFLPTNSLASWPTAARNPGEAYWGNSNGVVYLLTSPPDSTTWGATNKLAP